MAVLFESKAETLFDTIIVIDAPIKKRIQWLQSRGWTMEEIDQRIQSQMDIEEKKNRASIVIENNGTPRGLYKKIRKLFLTLKD
jgi:dephospho-CoA kinase